MEFFFHSEADLELDQTIACYEELRPGLGLEFAEEIYAAISRIIEFPNAWTRLTPNTRRCVVNRIPDGVIFQVRRNMLLIIAVANLHRLPDYWKDRT